MCKCAQSKSKLVHLKCELHTLIPTFALYDPSTHVVVSFPEPKCELRDVIQSPIPALHAVHQIEKMESFSSFTVNFYSLSQIQFPVVFVNQLRSHNIYPLITLA